MTQVIPETSPEYDSTRLIERPDGFYWQSTHEGREYGPFPTLLEAIQDMQATNETGAEPTLSLEEAESEFGTGYIDPQTGEPIEEGHPRLEDH